MMKGSWLTWKIKSRVFSHRVCIFIKELHANSQKFLSITLSASGKCPILNTTRYATEHFIPLFVLGPSDFPLIESNGTFLAFLWTEKDRAVRNKCFMNVLRMIEIMNTHSLTDLAVCVCDIHHLALEKILSSEHSPQKITRSCDYFFLADTYI